MHFEGVVAGNPDTHTSSLMTLQQVKVFVTDRKSEGNVRDEARCPDELLT
jgi:hypothetical protein